MTVSCFGPLAAALAIAAATGAVGCAEPYVSAGYVGGYSVAYPDTVPPYIANYPRVYYDGSYAYLANDRWYYPTQRGWVTFNQEPVELQRYRSYVQQAPPAYRGPAFAPPPVRGPGVYTAPPAVRVR